MTIFWQAGFTSICSKISERNDTSFSASPMGHLLRYDTSYGLGILSADDIGLGTTAPNHIRHWVGYSAIGYR